MNILKTYIPAVAAAIAATGCSLDIPYENQFSDPDAITTVTAARELLASAYYALPNEEYDLTKLTDDFEPTAWANSTPTVKNLYSWQPQSIIDMAQPMWSTYYTVISTANAVLERLPQVAISSEDDRRAQANIETEAKALKALCYFDLLRLFAPDYGDGADLDGIIIKDKVAMESLPRTSIGGCVTAIRRLLEPAVAAESSGSDEDGWLSNYAARYILAEVELYARNYDRAAELASGLVADLGTGVLSESSYNNLWSDNTTPARIFCYNNSKNAGSYYLGIVYDKLGGDYFSVARSIVNSYCDGDLRRDISVYETESATMGHMYYFGKYNAMRKREQEITRINKIRAAGAWFILAEAQARRPASAREARATLNEYLTARNAETVDDNLSGNALIARILAEKQKEFVGEGQRFFDLKRCRRDILAGWTAGQPADRRIAADDYRWSFPIPKAEYLYNENCSQNNGWPREGLNS